MAFYDAIFFRFNCSGHTENEVMSFVLRVLNPFALSEIYEFAASLYCYSEKEKTGFSFSNRPLKIQE